MNAFLYYLLQVMIASGILYGYYYIALRNRKFHQYNRFYLLTATLISILIPFLNIPVYFSTEESQSSIVFKTLTAISPANEEILVLDSGLPSKAAGTFFYSAQFLYCVYTLLSVVVMIKIAISLGKIWNLQKRNPAEKLGNIRFVRTNEPSTPFSFFRWMFWNKNIELNSEKGKQIFQHELFHIKQKHSIDTLFLELLTAVFWINPLFHLMKRELKTIHEFLADSFVVNDTQKWEYAELLLMQVLQTNQPLVNPFFHNQIKRRIAMITNPQKTSHRYLRKVLVLPVAAIVASLFAFTYRPAPAAEKKQAYISSLTTNTNNDTIPGKTVPVELPPSTNKNISRQPVKGTEIEFMEIQLSGSGAPGITGTLIPQLSIRSDSSLKPLIIVDGVKTAGDESLQNLNPNIIESITVLKGQQATDLYGAQARDGAVLITTKQNINYEEIVKDSSLKAVLITTKQNIDYDEIVKDSSLKNMSEIKVVGYAAKTIAEKAITPAIFNGGEAAWRKYLERNLNSNIPIVNKASPGRYTVSIQFIVNPDGTLSDIKALSRIGFGMEEEVIRVIKNGPNWIPAMQNGKAVSSYKTQPVTFSVMGNLADESADALKEIVVVGYPAKPESIITELAKTKPNKEKLLADINNLPPIYPNPTTHSVVVPVNAREAGKGELRVSDINGTVKIIVPVTYVKGSNNLNVKVGSLANGTYVISVLDANKRITGTYKLLKQ
jgi:TonB-dependent SusC/RagA subfamily outer membrane receptor